MHSKLDVYFLAILAAIIVLLLGVYFLQPKNDIPDSSSANQANVSLNVSDSSNASASAAVPANSANSAPEVVEPIAGALDRVTQKPFGIKVSPDSSPVSPEKFTGSHTGVDFETTPAEADIPVAVFAVCDGALLEKKYASGYGGVAVEKCQINNSDMTIIYGHLRLASISAQSGQALNRGERIGVLGKGYSAETDGERKHLHLGMHLGDKINLLGYVQAKSELGNWFDIMTLLK